MTTPALRKRLEEIAGPLRLELRRRFDRRDVRLEDLEKRVAAVEKHLGIEG